MASPSCKMLKNLLDKVLCNLTHVSREGIGWDDLLESLPT